jgi:hypothetical protein
VFPLSLVYAAMSAVKKAAILRRHRHLAAVAEAKTAASPVATLLWLDQVTAETSTSFDACLKLPGEGRAPDLHEVLSVLLASPRLQSIAFYWDEAALADDLPLWMARPDRLDPAAGGREQIDAPSPAEVTAFLQRAHQAVTLPTAALREAETLLKRLAGGGLAVCLNSPPEAGSVAGRLATELPLLRFFELSPAGADATGPPPNLVALHSWGFNLHERMVLVCGADAYVGRLDALAAVAVMAGRPTVLVADAPEVSGPREARGGRVLWVPADAAALVQGLRGFLDRHCRALGSP